MTKEDVITAVYSRTPLNRKQSRQAVEAILSEMKKTLANRENVVIRKFGEFRVRWKAQRIGLNPRTGEHVPVSERHVVTWKAGNSIRKRVNGS